MDIREALLAEYSKRQTMAVVDHIGEDPQRFRELMQCFMGDSYRVSQRAAWAVSYCAEHHPELVKPYFRRMIEQIERPDAHIAVRRNVARLLQFVEIPRRYRGRVFDACYDLVDDAGETVAVRAFALTVAANIANSDPDLLAELKLLADKHSPHMTIGFRTRARNIFAKL